MLGIISLVILIIQICRDGICFIYGNSLWFTNTKEFLYFCSALVARYLFQLIMNDKELELLLPPAQRQKDVGRGRQRRWTVEG